MRLAPENDEDVEERLPPANDSDDPSDDAGGEAEPAEDPEIDKPPPDVPPPAPIAARTNNALRSFDAAINNFKPLVTKSVTEFASTPP